MGADDQLSMLSDADDLAKRVSRLEAHLLQLEKNYDLLLEQLAHFNWWHDSDMITTKN